MDWGSLLSTGLEIGAGLYSAKQKEKARKEYENYLREQDERRYNDAKTNRDAYLEWYNSQAAAQGSGGGGGGGGSNDRKRNRLERKAQKQLKRGFKNAQKAYKPYVETGQRLLPEMEAAYKSGLSGVNTLFGYINTPAAVEAFKAPSGPAWSVDIPLPEHMRKKRGE